MPTTPPPPAFLLNSAAFREHVKEHFESRGSSDRGAAFLKFALKLFPFVDIFAAYDAPRSSDKVSYDGGVDFFAEEIDGTRLLCGQSKLRISGIEELDGIFSKFENYERTRRGDDNNGQTKLFRDGEDPGIVFAVVTSSDISSLINKFERTSLSSVQFYKELVQQERLIIADGEVLLSALRDAYYKTFVVPQEVSLTFAGPYIEVDGVFLGVADVGVVRDLYAKHGPAVFFENIREFLGVGQRAERETQVNDEIAKTLSEAPESMLRRNNGLTFKAEKVIRVAENELRMTRAGIVNGCQTTMCIVRSGVVDGAAKVIVKVVQSDDSWDIAKAANYQNSVSRIDLDLARFLRPQLLHKFAVDSGIGVDTASDGVTGVLNSIRTHQLSYDEMRYLFLGVFSRQPTNIFGANYNKLRLEALNQVEQNTSIEHIMGVLFKLLVNTREASLATEKRYSNPTYSSLFERFFREENPKYRCFLAILASCAATGVDLDETTVAQSSEDTVVIEFIKKIEAVLIKNSQIFRRLFELAFEVLATRILESNDDKTDMEIRAKMFADLERRSFVTSLRSLRLRMDGDPEYARLLAEPSASS